MLRRALVSALLAGVLAAPAQAQWSAPRTVSQGNPQVSEATVAFGGNGRALLSARLPPEAFGVPSQGFSRLFAEQPDGSFSGRGRLVLAAPPAVYGASRTALLRLPLTAGNLTIKDLDEPSNQSLGYGFGRTSGDFEFYHRLTLHGDRNNVAIAADGRGDVAAVWVEHLSGRDPLVAARRRPGGRFGRPAVIVGSGFLSSPSAAWSGRGDLIVAYQRSLPRRGHTPDRRVEARVRRSGHNWGAAQLLGGSTGFSEIQAAAA